MKKINIRKILLILGGIIVAYLLFSSFKKKSANKTKAAEKENKNLNAPRSGFPLTYGSKNIYVKALQRWLNAQKAAGVKDFGANLVIDGNFGNKTLSALRLIWQELEGYPIREVNETQYLDKDMHLYETRS